MITVTSDPETLKIIKERITQHGRNIQFGGNVHLGRLQIELDKQTADFIIAIINAVRGSRRKNVQIDVSSADSRPGITREFLGGYFHRK